MVIYSELVQSLERLYKNGLIDMVRVIMLFNDGKITEEEKKYILKIE